MMKNITSKSAETGWANSPPVCRGWTHGTDDGSPRKEMNIMKIWKDDENHTFVQVTTVDKIIAVCGIILFVIALVF